MAVVFEALDTVRYSNTQAPGIIVSLVGEFPKLNVHATLQALSVVGFVSFIAIMALAGVMMVSSIARGGDCSITFKPYVHR